MCYLATFHDVKDQDDFKQQIESAGEKLVVVEFYAQWCGQCKVIGPYFEELALEEQDDVLFLKVDCDEVEEVPAMYEVTNLPTFVFIKNKEKVDGMTGVDKEKLKNMITSLK